MLPQGAARSKGEGLDSSFLEPSEGAWPHQHPDLRLPASRTVSQSTYVVEATHLIWGTVLQPS